MSNLLSRFSTPKNSFDDEAKLKYFFLIDTENILSNIKESDSFKEYSTLPDSNGTEKLFHEIFHWIFSACHEYTKYLHVGYGANYTFFGNSEPLRPLLSEGTDCNKTGWHYSNSISYLLFLSLKYHCILHGCFTSLYTECTDFYKINPQHEDFLESSYTNIPSLPEEFLPNSRNKNNNFDSRTTFFSRKYKAIRTCPDHYSHKIIIQDITRSISEHRSDYRKVSSYFRNWGYFCFTEPVILSIDKCIKTPLKHPNTLFNKLDELHDNILHRLSSYDNNSDRILFGFPAEWYYCFSTTSYVQWMLNTVYNCAQKQHEPSSEAQLSQPMKMLGSLKGESFLNTIKKVYQLPNVYSRHFFLKYALTAGINSKDLEDTYLRPEKPLIEFSYPSQKRTATTNHILSRIDDFFDTLSNLTIPILEACWDTVIRRLNTELPSEKQITSRIYQQYINQNYALLTADFTTIPDNKLVAHCRSILPNETFEYESTLKTWISNCSQRPFLTTDAPVEVKKDTAYVLQNYFSAPEKFEISIVPLLSSHMNQQDILYNDQTAESRKSQDAASEFTYKRFKNIYDYFIDKQKKL